MHIDNGENWDPKKAEEEFKKRIIETISELKHCPFCGLQPEFKKINVNMGHENYDGFEISCKCGIKTGNKIYGYDGKTEEELKQKLLDIWNKRL